MMDPSTSYIQRERERHIFTCPSICRTARIHQFIAVWLGMKPRATRVLPNMHYPCHIIYVNVGIRGYIHAWMNDYYWLIVGPLTSHVKCPPNYMAMLSILLSLTFSIVTHESVLLLLILLFNLQQVNRSSNAIEIYMPMGRKVWLVFGVLSL